MNKKWLIVVLILSGCLSGYAQQTYTLRELIQKAEAFYPSVKQKVLAGSLGKENEKLLEMGLYPQVNLTGQATYQSEVTKFAVPGFSGIPTQKKDNYAMGIDFRFPLTEFTVIESKKQLEQTKTELSINQTETELQKVRERVTNIFGNILLQQESKKIIAIRHTELVSQHKKVASAVENGVSLKSNQLILESEMLSTDQRMIETDAAIKGLSKELSALTGMNIQPDGGFQLSLTETSSNNINRAELLVFKSQLKILDLQKTILQKEDNPKLFVFGQGYYGRPGYNFLNIDMRTYGILGAGINWNINNLLTQKTKEKTIEINKQMVNTQQENFNLNLQIALDQKQIEIDKYKSIISKDLEIVNTRKAILAAASSQLANGVITSTDYLSELNASNTAELNKVLHQVQLAIAKTQLQILSGN